MTIQYASSAPFRWLSQLVRSKRFVRRRKVYFLKSKRKSFLEKLEDRHTAGAALPLPLAMLAEALNVKPDLPQSDSAMRRALAEKERETSAPFNQQAPKPDWNALPANRFEELFSNRSLGQVPF